MEFSNEVGTEDEGVLSSAGGVFGVGVIFGIWRSCLGGSAREALDRKQRQRDAPLMRLKHPEDYAGKSERFATAA